jgi:hypothetical protein
MGMTFPITQEGADHFAQAWIAAWNSHDLDRICSHYAADVEFTSPFVTGLTGNLDGTVIRIGALRQYFSSALERFPGLEFKYMFACAGMRTITVVYGSISGLTAAETMELCAEGKIVRAFAQYSSIPRSV